MRLGFENKAGIATEEAPPSLAEYERRDRDVQRLAEEAARLAVEVFHAETASRDEAAHRDSPTWVNYADPPALTELKRRASRAREDCDSAKTALNAWSQRHKNQIWPPDELSPLERAKAIRDQERRRQLAEDLRALGIEVPEQ